MESSGSFFFQILNQVDVFLHRFFGGLALKLIPGIVLGSAFKIGKSRTGPAHIPFGTLFVEAVKLEQDIVCLLYTSPSPRDRQKSRMPSSA